MNPSRPIRDTVADVSPVGSSPAQYEFPLDEQNFHHLISLERKRTERSRKPFLLVLVDTGSSSAPARPNKALRNIVSVLVFSTRETDIKGWYRANSVAGVMFTEIGIADKSSMLSVMLARVSEALRQCLSIEQFSQVNISFHVFPDDWDHELSHPPSNPTLYPDLSKREEAKRFPSIIKRGIDIIGSVFALTAFSPLFLLITVAIKTSSKGSVFFCQERVGQYGRPFTFLKFRSMHIDNDDGIHKEWFRRFVSGQEELHPTDGNGNGSYKLPHDPRVTRVGRLLRRTSLDELPQLINVLKGEMSLVGPRPPIPYEVKAYQTWHRGRVLEAKPGMTGLWQVNGRSRVTFDEMVRLDLRYARNWTLWLDLKILAQTPRAILLGSGAY